MGISYTVTTDLKIPLPNGTKSIIARGGDFQYSLYGKPRSVAIDSVPDSVSYSQGVLRCVYDTFPTTVFEGEEIFVNDISTPARVKTVDATNKILYLICGYVETVTKLIFPKSAYIVENEGLESAERNIYVLGAGEIEVEIIGTNSVKKKI